MLCHLWAIVTDDGSDTVYSAHAYTEFAYCSIDMCCYERLFPCDNHYCSDTIYPLRYALTLSFK
ncbi:MAG TPA: hypothetical protein PL059_11980, partial [Spirochaetota bacterium]|nr:hypothetical protein [Spirochaetota bacterium]HOM10966.1 hypothetical protein [Spirochaetota bacterium]HXK66423.1 hypothetical protein [Spirochaetota bacterium]